MSEQQTIGRIAFGVNINAEGQPIPRTVRVIKAKDRDELGEDEYIDRHELSIISLMVKKHLRKDRKKTIAFLDKLMLTRERP